MKKQILKLGWLAAVIVMMATAPGEAAAIEQTPPSTDTDGYYIIESKEHLYWFAALVNGTLKDVTKNSAANARLNKDITVNESGVLDENGGLKSGTFENWTPIGYGVNAYTGTFDGQGHTISGLNLCDDNKEHVGLIGYAGRGATIKNVGVKDSYFKGSGNVGGVCGNLYNGTMSNCYNMGTVSGTGNYVGGVCGCNEGTISNCYNSGTVSCPCDVGGVCGYNWSGTISNCYNTGKVSGTTTVGGVCGRNYSNSTIENCNNTGTVSGTGSGVCGQNDDGCTIKYERTGLTAGSYGTICMPSAVKAGDRSGAEFYSIAGKTKENGKVTSIYLEEVTGDLVAGQPYIFKATSATLTCTCSTDYEQTAKTANGLVGKYEEFDMYENDNFYVLKGNKIYKRGSQVWKIAANRAYINMSEVPDYTPGSSAPARTIKIGVSDDGTTGIGSMTVEQHDGEYYTLQGQRVAAPSRGIYIVNGKKVIVK